MDEYRGYTDITTETTAASDSETTETPQGHDENIKESAAISFIKELPVLVLVALVVAWLIKSFIVQPFFIPSGSMEPTFTRGDHVLVNKFLYRFVEPVEGDVIVFRYPVDPDKDYIKRIVALPGQQLEIKNGKIYVDNKVVKEDYLDNVITTADFGPVTVPNDKYFVMGDNRNNSEDSRVWGTVPEDNILGKAFMIYWPLTRVDLVKS